eukprot:1072584-Pyramimonas_sp.AAC.1
MTCGVNEGGTDGHGGGCASSRAEERACVQFAYTAWRDHFVALATNLLSDQDNGRVRCTCKGVSDIANVGEASQRPNLVLMDVNGRGTWMEKMRLRLV